MENPHLEIIENHAFLSGGHISQNFQKGTGRLVDISPMGHLGFLGQVEKSHLEIIENHAFISGGHISQNFQKGTGRLVEIPPMGHLAFIGAKVKDSLEIPQIYILGFRSNFAQMGPE